MGLQALRDPFPAADIEWRIGRAGKKGDNIWARVLAYITSRAIMDRLDAVCGPAGWQTDFRQGDGHLMAGLGILIDDGWVWKWDGTGLLDASGGLSGTDAGKGDFSNALKRAAVQWGIGRYLYNLDEGWATVHADGSYFARLPKDKGGDAFRWDPPALPGWALPGGDGEASNEDREKLAELVEELQKVGLNGNDAQILERCATLAAEGGAAQNVARAIDWAETILGTLQGAT